MSISFEHERWKPLLLLPGGYFYFSRLRKLRDLAVNVIQWPLPSAILAVGLSGGDYVQGLILFAAGLLIFVALYEIGYLTNDSYGLRDDPTPRARVKIRFDTAFVSIFILIRLLVVGVTIYLIRIYDEPIYWAALIALVAALVAHNIIKKVQFKFATFLQLSLLRFSLPALPPILLSGNGFQSGVLLLSGLLLFSFPRLVTYQDAKGRLTLPERKHPMFLLTVHLLTVPFVALLSIIAKSYAPLVALTALIIMHVIYNFTVGRRTSAR